MFSSPLYGNDCRKGICITNSEQKEIIVTDNGITLDKTDLKILGFLKQGIGNGDIAQRLNVDSSTVLRRTKRLENGDVCKNHHMLNYRCMGFKHGYLHLYTKQADIGEVMARILKVRGVLTVGYHIYGNSDIVVEFVYRDADTLGDFIKHVKKWSEVDRIVWSEELELMFADPSTIDLRALIEHPRHGFEQKKASTI